jgi:hypothetical protein
MISYRMRRILPVLLLSIALGFLATATFRASRAEKEDRKKAQDDRHRRSCEWTGNFAV